jgi:hypothetical protein
VASTWVGLRMFAYFNGLTKAFFYFLCSTLIIQLALTTCYLLKINNLFLINIYFTSVILYSLYLVYTHFNKKIFYLLLVVLPVLIWALVNDIMVFNINLFIIASICCCMVNAMVIIQQSDKENILLMPQFYISAGLLVYIFSISGVMLLFNYVINPNNNTLDLFYTIFSSVMTLVANMFYIKAFICSKKKIY